LQRRSIKELMLTLMMNKEPKPKIYLRIRILREAKRGNTILLILIAQILQTHSPIPQIVYLSQNHTLHLQWIQAHPVIIDVREEKGLRRINASPRGGRVSMQRVRGRLEDQKGNLDGTTLTIQIRYFVSTEGLVADIASVCVLLIFRSYGSSSDDSKSSKTDSSGSDSESAGHRTKRSLPKGNITSHHYILGSVHI
jgi:hypothetical protein